MATEQERPLIPCGRCGMPVVEEWLSAKIDDAGLRICGDCISEKVRGVVDEKFAGAKRNLAAEQMEHQIRVDRAYLMLEAIKAGGGEVFTVEQIRAVLCPALGLSTD